MPAIQPSGGKGGGVGTPGTPGKSAYQSWLDLGNVGTEAQWQASLKGTDGTSAPNPLLITTLTGGTLGNAVMRSKTNPAVCADIVNTDKERVFSQQPIYIAKAAGEYYMLGGAIPGSFGSGDVGKLVLLGDKTSASGSNLVLAFEGSEPPTVLPGATTTYLPLGIVDSTISWSTFQRAPITGADNPIQVFYTGAEVATGGTSAKLTEMWNATNETLTVVTDAGSTPTWPNGRYIKHTMATALRHAWVVSDATLFSDGVATFKDGAVGTRFAFTASTPLQRAARLYLRVGGAATSELGIALDLNFETGRLKAFVYPGGSNAAGSADLAGTPVNAVTGAAYSALSPVTLYDFEAYAIGNRVMARATLTGQPMPDWTDTNRTIDFFQTVVPNAGYAGFASANGNLDVRFSHIAVTKNYGPPKWTP